jgi:hypothetical protein
MFHSRRQKISENAQCRKPGFRGDPFFPPKSLAAPGGTFGFEKRVMILEVTYRMVGQ